MFKNSGFRVRAKIAKERAKLFYRNVTSLFFVLTIVSVGLFSYGVDNDVFNGEKSVSVQRVVREAHAQELEKNDVIVLEVEITDCNSAIDQSTGPKELMKRISDTESGNDPHAKNKVSSASGCFQFVNGTWHRYGLELWGDDFYDKNIFDPKDNTDLAAYVMNNYGTSDWDSSRSIWAK